MGHLGPGYSAWTGLDKACAYISLGNGERTHQFRHICVQNCVLRVVTRSPNRGIIDSGFHASRRQCNAFFPRAIFADFRGILDRQSAMAGVAALCIAGIVCLAPAPHARADDAMQIAGLLDLLKERLKRAEKPEDDRKTKRKTKKKAKTKQKSKRTTKQKKKPSTARLRIAVVGDSLAQDLWFGMRRVFFAKKDIEVVRLTKSASGLVRDDSYDWIEKLTGFVEEERFEIAVVMFGGNDRQNIPVNGKRLPRLSKKWIVEYGNRIDAVVDLSENTCGDRVLGRPAGRALQQPDTGLQENEPGLQESRQCQWD